MTLCAILWSDNNEFMLLISDALLTTSEPGGPPLAVPSMIHPVLNTGTKYAAGLRLKSHVWNDRILFSFSGRLLPAQNAIRFIIEKLDELETPRIEEVDHILSLIRDKFGNTFDLFVCLIDEEVFHWRSFGHKAYPMKPFSRALILGSGKIDFLEDLDSGNMNASENAPSLLIEAIHYIGGTLIRQGGWAFGIDNAWGAAMELTIRLNNGYHKVDDVLVRLSLVTFDNEGILSYDTPVRFYYHKYVNGGLYVASSSNVSDDGYTQYYIPGLISDDVEILADGQYMVETMIDAFIVEDAKVLEAYGLPQYLLGMLFTNVTINPGALKTDPKAQLIRDYIKIQDGNLFVVHDMDHVSGSFEFLANSYVDGISTGHGK